MYDNTKEILFSLLKSKKVEINIECPDCDKRDGAKKLYFNIKKQIGLCFRCGRTYDLLRLAKALGKSGDFIKLPISKSKKPDTTAQTFSVESVYDNPDALKYLLKRNISPTKINKFKIFYSPKGTFRNRIIIPLYYEEKLFGLVGRIIKDELSDKKYLFQSGTKVKEIIYPECNLDREVYLVEGSIDAIVANGICTFTSFISNEQVQILKDRQVEQIYLCFDFDTWQVKNKQKPKIIKAYDKLEEAGFEVLPIKMPEGQDPAKMGSATLRKFALTQSIWLNIYTIKTLKRRFKDYYD
jgi:DNA primase